MFESVSIVAIIGSGISSMILGSAWYGPLFGKTWTTLEGWTEADIEQGKKQNMAKTYGIQFVGSLVFAAVLGMFARTIGALTLTDGLVVGFWAWLGFALPLLLGSVLWNGKPWKLYALHAGYNLVQFALIGAIVTLWG